MKSLLSLVGIGLGLLVSPATARAQGMLTFTEVVPAYEAKFDPPQAMPGETVTWRLTLQIDADWHTYSVKEKDLARTSVQFPKDSPLRLQGELSEAPAAEDGTGIYVGKKVLHGDKDGRIVFEGKFEIAPTATPGAVKFDAVWNVVVCNEMNCLPREKISLSSPLTIKPLPETPPLHLSMKRVADGLSSLSTYLSDLADENEVGASVAGGSPQDDLLAFVLSGVIWGAISLITPCVFPMIPITVSFFLKQSEQAGHRPVLMALVYSLTIVIILTIGAVLLLKSFQELIQHWGMNLFLGGLFIFFALSLFGMYDIELPAALTRFTSSHEGQGGLVGTIFMALTFTIVSFACVAPMLGGFAGLTAAAQSGADWLQLVLGALAFSVTFAAPFFFLALFPTLLKSMPKSGSWLNAVKVVMGFVEFAAALKFLRAAQLLLPERSASLVWPSALALGGVFALIRLLQWMYSTVSAPVPTVVKAAVMIVVLTPLTIVGDIYSFDLVLSGFIVLSILCGIYLLGFVRLPHDVPEDHIGVPRFLFATVFILLGIYLLPGTHVFGGESAQRQRPKGTVFAWIESFILPSSEKSWYGDFDKALADAREKKRRIFIDFTGVT